MNADSPIGVMIVLTSFIVTFVLARVLGSAWRRRRTEREEQRRREGESRQVRRARERRQRG